MTSTQIRDDWREIEVLHSRFFHAVDRRSYDLIPPMYTADAVDDRGAFKGSVPEFMEWVKQAYAGIENSSHIMTNLLIAFDGDKAESEGREMTYVRLKAPNAVNILIVSRQFDRYKRHGGRWLFSHRALCTDWVQVMPETQRFSAIDAMPVGVAGAADPVYQRVPLLTKWLRETSEV